MRKYISILFAIILLTSFLSVVYTANITTQSAINLKPENEEQQITDNATLIVYPDQTIELRMLHEETPGPENGSADLFFELTKENETYLGTAEAQVVPPEDELGPFANISSLSLNGSYIDGQLIGTGAIVFVAGMPITTIFINYNINETVREFTFEMESLLPLLYDPYTGEPQLIQPFEITPEEFASNISMMVDQFSSSLENCTLQVLESKTTLNSAFVKINVTTDENFILGEFNGIVNVTAFFEGSFVDSITVSGLLEGEGNAKIQFEIVLNFTNGILSSVSVDILLTDSADKWTFTASGEATFTNVDYFALTSLDISLTFEGNATEALCDLVEILKRLGPPPEEGPTPEELIELMNRIFEALTNIEIEKFFFELNYANGEFSFESNFELSGDLDSVFSEVKDALLDFAVEMDPNVTEEIGFQLLDKTNVKFEHIQFEIHSSPTKTTGMIIIDRIDTEIAGNATFFRYPLLFNWLNESEFEGKATLKIIGGENETHWVFLDIPEGVPEPMEQTDRYAIWNITEDFEIAKLGEVVFESRQVVFPTVIAGQEAEVEIMANVSGVTISNVSYTTGYTTTGMTKGIKLVVTGPTGTIATVNITIPKEVVPSGAQLTVYVGEEPVDATIIETETEYIIMVTVHFSEVIIYVEFTTPVERYLFAMIGGVVVLLLIIVAAASLFKKKK